MRTERGLDRLITFLDAVVAIAITLLVLPLVDLAGAPSDTTTATLLADHVGELVVFLLSFVVIARLWRVHHALLEHAGSYDRTFVWINLAWALTIVVLPFATQLTTRGSHDRTALAVYIGTMAVSGACLAAIALLLDSRPALRREEDGEEDVPVRIRPTVASVVAFLVALVLGLTVPGVGYWGLLVLAVDDRVARLVTRKT